MRADEEDIEGLRFYDEDGAIYDYKANAGDQFLVPVTPLDLPGRPIGFKLTTGTNQSTSQTPDMPLIV